MDRPCSRLLAGVLNDRCRSKPGLRGQSWCSAPGAEGLSCRQPAEERAMTMIDMHAHWRPAEVAEALRARGREPRIVRNEAGIEVLKMPRMGETPLAAAFDDVEVHLARMDKQGVETSVLSLLGNFCWIESQPADVSGPLCRSVNDALSAICQKH